jgi:signal transduction histidine kinase
MAILLLLFVFALAALAGLQYRWINRVSEADRSRRHEAAEFVARRIAEGLRVEIHRTFESFLGTEDADVWSLYDDWIRGAPWPNLIPTVYAAEREDTQWTLKKLDARDGLVAVPWPKELAPMQAALQTLEPRGPETRWPTPLFANVPGLMIVQRPVESDPLPRDIPTRVVMLPFDKQLLTETIVPGLFEQVMGDGDQPTFDISIVAENGTVIHQSNPSWRDAVRTADASAIVPPAPRSRLESGSPRHSEKRKQGPPRKEGRRKPGEPERPVNIGDWQVLVRYSEGGLDELVASTRRRNLAVGGGILAILGAGVAVLVLLVRRADRLRAQEAAFVSVMSHELNTPVAVLRSAGENLKDGIVAANQVPVYGDTIVQEADRLKHMIAEVLELAKMQARTDARPLRTLALAPIVESVVERCRLLVNGKIRVEADIEPNLPPVAADDEALGRAIQNLIVNAIRHGGSGGWVGVRVRRDGKRVTITVEDRGPGIHADDFDQIFEPFYRGHGSSQVSGAGLGLTIVKQIAIDHGGSVTLDKRDAGAAFTIHLPAEVRGA